MNNIKILIEIEKGTLVRVAANADIQYVLIDRDDKDRTHGLIMEPDQIVEEINEVLDNPEDAEIRSRLEILKF